jgi:hypothetical protein
VPSTAVMLRGLTSTTTEAKVRRTDEWWPFLVFGGLTSVDVHPPCVRVKVTGVLEGFMPKRVHIPVDRVRDSQPPRRAMHVPMR